LFTVLFAAYHACLHRWSGQDDIVVGTPLAGRSRAGFDRVVGYFVNVLPLRARLTAGMTFRELIEQVRATALDALEHEDFPLLDIVDAVRPTRVPGRAPLFQALFAFERSFNSTNGASTKLAFGLEDRAIRLGPLSLEPLALDLGGAQVDVGLTCIDSDGPITCILQYNTDLFDHETMESFARSFQVLLARAVASPDVCIDDLGLIDAHLRRRVLLEYNPSPCDVPLPSSIHRIVELQVDRTPDAVAVVVDDFSITFSELDRRAAAVAEALIEHGAGPETVVGTCLPRSIEMVVAVLGILKAGAAYLPLDPMYPPNRLRLMLDDSAARILIVDDEDASRFDGYAGVVLRPDAMRAAPGLGRRPGTAVLPDQLAYVIYTSGSTGRPKGVQVRHGAVANLLSAMMASPTISPHEVVVGVTSLSFDVSVVDLFLPLAVGARLVLARRDDLVDGVRLKELIERVGGAIMQGTPSTWRLLLGSGWPAGGGLRAWCAGEALSPALAQAIRDAGGELWNLYGPTETTVYSSGERVRDATITIGRPIANTELHIVDDRLELTPPGVIGELLIGGSGVARGYLGRPDLTAERFIPDPFARDLGARLYRTGDRARHRSDGRVDYAGRADHQVKLRGFRIEIGEIEAAILRHPSVAAAVVTVDDEGGDPVLVAYHVTRPGMQTPTPRELRDALRLDLPEHMVPSFFTSLDEFPLTSSGKLDRRSLPRVRRAAVVPEQDLPRTPLERLLAGIMRDVLRVDLVPTLTSFFDLGGHSLMATQVIGRIEESLGVRPPVATLFEHSSVRALATWFELRHDAAVIRERAELVLQILEMTDEEATQALGDRAATAG
jgi:amino acid adenylation domain-containing protein